MAEEETRPRPSRRRPAAVAVVIAALAGVIALVARDDWERAGPPIEVVSWAPYWQTNAAYESFDANIDVFGDVSIVAYHATGAGEITAYPNLAADAIARFAARARPAGVELLATIFDDTDSGVMAGVLADPALRAAHARAVADVVSANDFDGVDLDYETFAFADSRDTWESTRPNWVAFLEELTALLRPQGKLVVVSVPQPAYTVYDHRAMGAIVDRIRIMTYDYSTSTPGPIAPAEWVRDVVDGLKDLVPPEKIDLGIPAYGRDWPVAIAGTCPADQQPGTRSVTPAVALALAEEHGAVATWDDEAEEARFDYAETRTGADASGATTTCTVTRTVWFLDDRAIHRRAWIAHRENLHGVAIWALGNDDPSLWTALRSARGGEQEWTSPTLPPRTSADTPPAS